MDAGKLCHRLTLLELRSVKDGDETIHQWAEARKVWGRVDLSDRTNLFSRVGIGARDATITLRDTRHISLFHAIRWDGRHLFLTSMTREDGFITAKAAVVCPSYWTATTFQTGVDRERRNSPKREKLPPVHFPAVLTEKYLGHEPPEDLGHAVSETRYVLVTPKAVQMAQGDLVTTREVYIAGTYVVETCHCLDAYKNEYEVYRKGDV